MSCPVRQSKFSKAYLSMICC